MGMQKEYLMDSNLEPMRDYMKAQRMVDYWGF